MIGVVNETMVWEFCHEYKTSTTIEDAVMYMRGVVFRVNSWKLNEFLGFPDDIESDFLDVDVSSLFLINLKMICLLLMCILICSKIMFLPW